MGESKGPVRRRLVTGWKEAESQGPQSAAAGRTPQPVLAGLLHTSQCEPQHFTGAEDLDSALRQRATFLPLAILCVAFNLEGETAELSTEAAPG